MLNTFDQMNEKRTHNAVAALLGEYERAIKELLNVIGDLGVADLTTIVDHLTANPDCKSIQTILAHVVSSGYSYCIYIRELKSKSDQLRRKIQRDSVAEYKKDLDEVFKFTSDTFALIDDNELEEFDENKKIKTAWGQAYDIEQLMEHAIVHVLRHRRQIERFKILLKI